MRASARVCVCVIRACDKPAESHVAHCFLASFDFLSFLVLPNFSQRAVGMAVFSLATPTKLWELTGRETGRSFLYLQNVADAPWTRNRSLGICI